MYFSQWQRGKKKNLCVKPRSGSRDGCQRVWAYSSWLCAHHGGPWALWSPYSSVFDGRTHMGSSWKNLVSCPTHWVKNTNVICPFFEENLPKSRSTMLWESLRKCENCLRWQYTLGEWPQIFHERLINPKALLWLFSTPLVWPVSLSYLLSYHRALVHAFLEPWLAFCPPSYQAYSHLRTAEPAVSCAWNPFPSIFARIAPSSHVGLSLAVTARSVFPWLHHLKFFPDPPDSSPAHSCVLYFW